MDSENAVKRIECELYSPSTWTISIGLDRITNIAGYSCKIVRLTSNTYDIQYKVKEDEFSTLSSAFVNFPDQDGYSDVKTSTNVGINLTFNKINNIDKDKAKEILEYFIRFSSFYINDFMSISHNILLYFLANLSSSVI